ncbi:solute carrier family 25 member 44 isoform X3 [Bos indicus]|uniref:Solute carrier family 25 member 44 isoform X3 n=1 Tax=Bos indicus TaxID=9915 RepID=A0ABM4RZV6_BOSIN|nr:solute carrier family 25 member 44 isoform X4 [Bos taurus]XP_061259673.1 solute carrier family 25 member 44 isoform X3 [Bos javanicus]
MRFADNERSMARGMARDKSEDPEAAVRGPGQKQLKACVIWTGLWSILKFCISYKLPGDAHATGLCRTLSSRDLEQHCSAELSAIIEVFCCLQNAFTHITSAPRSPGTMEDKRNIQIIEWEHLDKKKFYVFGVAMTMMIRVSVYPFTLIRTRLQVQKGRSLYHGTFDAFIKILRADGVTGLYRGFLVNTFTLISGQCYVTTYELTRKFVADYSQSNTVKSLVAGGSASLVAQSITVPIDVVSQHLMMQRKGEKMGRFQVRGNPEGQGVVAFGQTKDIIRQILRADGLRGFYRGYVASLLTYIPNSAVWWPFYHFYAALIPLPKGVPSHCLSSRLGASGCSHCFHPHQSHGRHPNPSTG